jgi:hypothetical protein
MRVRLLISAWLETGIARARHRTAAAAKVTLEAKRRVLHMTIPSML